MEPDFYSIRLSFQWFNERTRERERERERFLEDYCEYFFVSFHADFVSPLSFHWFVTFGSAPNQFGLSLHCAGGNGACFYNYYLKNNNISMLCNYQNALPSVSNLTIPTRSFYYLNCPYCPSIFVIFLKQNIFLILFL